MTSLSWDRHSGHASSYDVVANGYNYRLDDLHAALGRAQLVKLPTNNQRRRELLCAYRSGLRLSDGWLMPFADHIESSSGHLMALLAPNPDARNRLALRLREAGIQIEHALSVHCRFRGLLGAARLGLAEHAGIRRARDYLTVVRDNDGRAARLCGGDCQRRGGAAARLAELLK